MRTLTLALCVVGAVACQRDDCTPRAIADDPVDEDALLTLTAAFVDQLGPELSFCVPSIEHVDADGGDPYEPGDRRIRLSTVDPPSVHHALAHALFDQNDLDLDAPTLTALPVDEHPGFSPVDEAFATAAEVSVVYGALLVASCPDDGPRVPAYRAAGAPFDPVDLSADALRPGVYVAPAAFVETLRVSGGGVLLADADTLAVWVDGVIVATTSFTGDDALETALRVSPRPLDAYEGVGSWSWSAQPDGAWVRRVFREAGAVRLLGDGCLRADEATFSWSDREWSTWMDGDAMVVGYWDMPDPLVHVGED